MNKTYYLIKFLADKDFNKYPQQLYHTMDIQKEEYFLFQENEYFLNLNRINYDYGLPDINSNLLEQKIDQMNEVKHLHLQLIFHFSSSTFINACFFENKKEAEAIVNLLVESQLFLASEVVIEEQHEQLTEKYSLRFKKGRLRTRQVESIEKHLFLSSCLSYEEITHKKFDSYREAQLKVYDELLNEISYLSESPFFHEIASIKLKEINVTEEELSSLSQHSREMLKK